MSGINLLLSDLAAQSAYLCRAVLLMVLLAAAFLFAQEHGSEAVNKLKQLFRQGWMTAFLFYLAFMLISTVFSRETTNPYSSVLSHFGFQDDVKWNNEIIENVLLFIPYTFFFLQSFKVEHPLRSAALVSGFTTLFIELSQLLFWLGSFQFSDIVHNMLGGMLGCGLWYMIRQIKRTAVRQKSMLKDRNTHDKR